MDPRELSMTIDGEAAGHAFRGNQYKRGVSVNQAQEVAKSLGIPTSQLNVLSTPHEFSDTIKGEAVVGEGKITLHLPAHTSVEELRQTMAHEYGHLIYDSGSRNMQTSIYISKHSAALVKTVSDISDHAKNNWESGSIHDKKSRGMGEAFADVHAALSGVPLEGHKKISRAWKGLHALVMSFFAKDGPYIDHTPEPVIKGSKKDFYAKRLKHSVFADLIGKDESITEEQL